MYVLNFNFVVQYWHRFIIHIWHIPCMVRLYIELKSSFKNRFYNGVIWSHLVATFITDSGNYRNSNSYTTSIFVIACIKIQCTFETDMKGPCDGRPPSVLRPLGQNVWGLFITYICYLWFKTTCLLWSHSQCKRGGLSRQVWLGLGYYC